MRGEISKLHHNLQATTIYVTHDQIEAMTMASRIVVMKDGYIQQVGEPKTIYDNPANVFVAGFIGTPPMNFITGKCDEAGVFTTPKNDCKLNIPAKQFKAIQDNGLVNKEIIVGIRPEHIYDDEESAYKKEENIVNLDFLKLDHVYNACLGGKHYNNYKTLYQFNLKGNLVKVWKYSKEAYEFYGYPMEKFEYAIHNKHPFLDCLWSTKSSIDITEYITKKIGNPKVTYLYSKGGKFLGEVN
jgi:ABC-type sugar transport system ATPase subunit